MNHADSPLQVQSGSFGGSHTIAACPRNRITILWCYWQGKSNVSMIEGCRIWTKNFKFIWNKEWWVNISTLLAIRCLCGLPVDQYGFPGLTIFPEHTFIQIRRPIINSKRSVPSGRWPSYRSFSPYSRSYETIASFMRSLAISSDKGKFENGRPSWGIKR